MNLPMRCGLVRCFYRSNKSATATLRLYKKEKKLKNNPCNRSTIVKLIQKFERTYTLHDLPRSKSSFIEERIEIVTEAIQTTSNETQSTSLRKVSNATGIPKSSVQRIMRTDLNLYLYKLQMLQKLNDEDKGARLNFSEWLRNDSVNTILWYDEAYFYLDVDISRHHCRIWTTSKPSHYLTKRLHPQKTCVWFAFSSKFKLQPFFFDSPINSESYLEMLRNNVNIIKRK